MISKANENHFRLSLGSPGDDGPDSWIFLLRVWRRYRGKNLERAGTLLRDAAWDSDANAPTSNDKRIALLKQANELLQDIPLGGYHGHLVKAQGYVKDALNEATKGAADKDVTGYIHDAETEVRAMEE